MYDWVSGLWLISWLAICLLPNFGQVILSFLFEPQFPKLGNGGKNRYHKDSRGSMPTLPELIFSCFLTPASTASCVPCYSSAPALSAPGFQNVLCSKMSRPDPLLVSWTRHSSKVISLERLPLHPLTDVISTPKATLLHQPGLFVS